MRILFLSNFYPPYEIGGYEQWCAEVASGLAAKGHQIEILTSNHVTPRDLQDINSPVSRVLYLESDISYYQPANFFLKHASQERSNLQMLRRKIDTFRPDIIMVWGMWNLSQNLAYWAEQWMPNRVAYFISNYWPMDIDTHTAYWRLPAKHSLMELVKRPLRSTAIARLQAENYPPKLCLENAVCCSEFVRNTLVNAGKLPASARVMLGGIDTKSFLNYSKLSEKEPKDKPETLQLLYFGRLIHDKGVHSAIEALGLLMQQNVDNIRLTILGSGHPAYEDHLRNFALRLGVDAKIDFIRQVPREAIPELLSKFDVFLFTSIWPEPMARSVMEAMAAGLLVIGTQVGGQSEMLWHGLNSLTFPPGDASSLANQIVEIWKDWPLRIRLARAGQEMVLQQFTLERMVNDIENHLLSVLQVPYEDLS